MKPNLHNQGGQLIVEAVLIIVLLMAVTFSVAHFFKGQDLIKKLISGPWVSLAGLIQNGVWLPVEQSNVSHPNGHGRHIVITGEPVQ
ncbi:MAG: hypothetical protein ACXVA9_13240 [Bdellovibrionales bacterium]